MATVFASERSMDENGVRQTFGTSEDDFLFASSDADHLNGGAGADWFIFENSTGHDAIFGWEASDKVEIAGYGSGEFNDILQRMSMVDGSTVITLNDTDTITFVGVDMSQFHSDQFLIV